MLPVVVAVVVVEVVVDVVVAAAETVRQYDAFEGVGSQHSSGFLHFWHDESHMLCTLGIENEHNNVAASGSDSEDGKTQCFK